MATEHAPLAHQFDDLAQQHEAGTLGMWLFLATELMVFGALFTGYAAYRCAYLREFEEASRHLNLLIGGVNTLVLLTSSLTMALAIRAAQLDRRKAVVGCLGLTALLGTAFMVLKAVEYYIDYLDNLVPGLAFEPQKWSDLNLRPERVELFLLLYYIMTALHALHLIVGIGVLIVMIVLSEGWHTAFGLAIATAKAVLVALFFMHVLYGPRLTRVVIVGALLWLAILIGLTLSDYLTRSWLAY